MFVVWVEWFCPQVALRLPGVGHRDTSFEVFTCAIRAAQAPGALVEFCAGGDTKKGLPEGSPFIEGLEIIIER